MLQRSRRLNCNILKALVGDFCVCYIMDARTTGEGAGPSFCDFDL